MSRRGWGIGAVLTLGVILVGPAPAAAAAACSGSSGVTVVVDYGSLGGIQVGCAAGDPSSGLSAMHSAGFATIGTQHDGPGFVCRINGAPASDPCVRTPPTTAYWSYWHASRGGSWAYSSVGAAGRDPAPGSVEGWAFGAGARPAIAPPAAPAPPPAPKPTTKPAPKPTVNPPAPPRTSTAPPAPGRPGTTAAAGAPGVTRGPGGAATSGRPSAAPSTSASGSGTQPSAGSSAAGAPATEDPGPPASVATEPASNSSKTVGAFSLGGALVLGLGTAAFLIARRRRASGPPSL